MLPIIKLNANATADDEDNVDTMMMLIASSSNNLHNAKDNANSLFLLFLLITL